MTADGIDTTERLDDAVRLAAAGDLVAFETLYRRHAGRAWALARRLGGRERAEEIVQDAFVRCWLRLRGFRGDGSFDAWLARIVTRVAWDALRREGRDVSLDAETAATRRPAPGDRLDLEALISELPPRARVVFVLHDVQGWSHPEIAEHLGISKGTSKSQLHRARELLRRRLHDGETS